MTQNPNNKYLSAVALTLAQALTVVSVAGCGTLARDGGGAVDLPVSGAGPYNRQPDPLLADLDANLDDSQVFADGDRLIVYLSRRTPDGRSTIVRADPATLTDTSSMFTPMITADAAWESGAVAEPALVPALAPGGRSLLFYQAAGRIGLAVGDGTTTTGNASGAHFTKAAMPVLSALPEEGAALASPAAFVLRTSDGTPTDTVRLFYLAGGALYAADASFSALVSLAPNFVRVDGDPATPARDPMLRAGDASWLKRLGRTTARSLRTAAGSARYDLFVSGAVDKPSVVGFASSFDALHFSVAATPFLDAKDDHAPSVTAYNARSVLLFTRSEGIRTIIAAATSP